MLGYDDNEDHDDNYNIDHHQVETSNFPKLEELLSKSYINTTFFVATGFSIFGDDFFIAWLPKSMDSLVYTIYLLIFLLFIIEIVCMSLTRPQSYLKSIRFYNDLCVIITMLIFDISVVSGIFASGINEDISGMPISYVVRGGRPGSSTFYWGRLTRLSVLFRIVKMAIYFNEKKANEYESHLSPQSYNGNNNGGEIQLTPQQQAEEDKDKEIEIEKLENDLASEQGYPITKDQREQISEYVNEKFEETRAEHFGLNTNGSNVNNSHGTKSVVLNFSTQILLFMISLLFLLPIFESNKLDRSYEYGLKSLDSMYATDNYQLAIDNFQLYHTDIMYLQVRKEDDPLIAMNQTDIDDIRDIGILKFAFNSTNAFNNTVSLHVNIEEHVSSRALTSLFRNIFVILILALQSGYLVTFIYDNFMHMYNPNGGNGSGGNNDNIEQDPNAEIELTEIRTDQNSKKYSTGSNELLEAAMKSVIQSNTYLKDSAQRSHKRAGLNMAGLESPLTAIFRMLHLLQESVNISPTQQQQIESILAVLASGQDLYMPNLLPSETQLYAYDEENINNDESALAIEQRKHQQIAKENIFAWLYEEILDNNGVSFMDGDDGIYLPPLLENNNRRKAVKLSGPVPQAPNDRKYRATKENEAKFFLNSILGDETLARIAQADENDWNYDMFILDDLTRRNPLMYISYVVMNKDDLFNEFDMNMIAFVEFISKIESLHEHNNPFHNSIHAAQVVLNTHHLIELHREQLNLDSLEILALYIAGMVKDVAHPGVSNKYVNDAYDAKCIIYSDQHPLQSHHLALCFRLLRDIKYNFLRELSYDEFEKLRQYVILLVTATDFKKHFDVIIKLETLNAVEAKPAKSIIMSGIIKLADLGYTAMDINQHKKWANLLQQEMYIQGDYERSQNMEISVFCDRNINQFATQQRGIFEYMILPLFDTMMNYLDSNEFRNLHDRALRNRIDWVNLQQKELYEEARLRKSNNHGSSSKNNNLSQNNNTKKSKFSFGGIFNKNKNNENKNNDNEQNNLQQNIQSTYHNGVRNRNLMPHDDTNLEQTQVEHGDQLKVVSTKNIDENNTYNNNYKLEFQSDASDDDINDDKQRKWSVSLDPNNMKQFNTDYDKNEKKKKVDAKYNENDSQSIHLQDDFDSLEDEYKELIIKQPNLTYKQFIKQKKRQKEVLLKKKTKERGFKLDQFQDEISNIISNVDKELIEQKRKSLKATNSSSSKK